MNKKLIAITAAVIVICALSASVAYCYLASPASSMSPTGELDLTINGSSSCLRFLNDSVPMVYLPFTVAANQPMQLTINASKMPANGYTEVYVYNGYWNQIVNNTCKSGDVYSILSDIKSVDFTLNANKPYIAIFQNTTQKSYTMFFVFPPGGPTTFHVTLKPT